MALSQVLPIPASGVWDVMAMEMSSKCVDHYPPTELADAGYSPESGGSIAREPWRFNQARIRQTGSTASATNTATSHHAV